MEKEIKLQRDICENCLKLKKQRRKNYLGYQLYCSQGHANELLNIKKSQATKNFKKEIFDTIYQWGRASIVADENSPAIKKMLDDLEETWY